MGLTDCTLLRFWRYTKIRKECLQSFAAGKSFCCPRVAAKTQCERDLESVTLRFRRLQAKRSLLLAVQHVLAMSLIRDFIVRMNLCLVYESYRKDA